MTLDTKREQYAGYFQTLAMDVRRQDIQTLSSSDFFLPNVQKRRVADAVGAAKSPTRLSQWFGRSEIKETFIDKARYIKDLEASLRTFFEPLSAHLQWWHRSINYSFLTPLENKISALESDLKNMTRGIEHDTSQGVILNEVSAKLQGILEDVRAIIERGNRLGPYASTSTIHIQGQKKGRASFRNLFIQLGAYLFENQFHSLYMDRLSAISASPHKTIALIANTYDTHLSFLRMLMRLDTGQMGSLVDIGPPN